MRYLLDEKPLLVMPSLATAIGLNESIVVQQIHYWLGINKEANINFYDGYFWTYNTIDSWQAQFPFWSRSTTKRMIAELEKINLLVVGNYNKSAYDRTKWYRIDYEVLENLVNNPNGSNWPNDSVQNEPMNKPNLTHTIPDTISYTNTDNNMPVPPKEKKKSFEVQVFELWKAKAEKTKALVNHGELTEKMKMAIRKSNLNDIDKAERVLDRFIAKYESKKRSDFPLSNRPLAEFFGMKAYGKPWLIWQEYDDDENEVFEEVVDEKRLQAIETARRMFGGGQ